MSFLSDLWVFKWACTFGKGLSLYLWGCILTCPQASDSFFFLVWQPLFDLSTAITSPWDTHPYGIFQKPITFPLGVVGCPLSYLCPSGHVSHLWTSPELLIDSEPPPFAVRLPPMKVPQQPLRKCQSDHVPFSWFFVFTLLVKATSSVDQTSCVPMVLNDFPGVLVSQILTSCSHLFHHFMPRYFPAWGRLLSHNT